VAGNTEQLSLKRMGTAADPVMVVSGAFTGDSDLSLSDLKGVETLSLDLVGVTRMNSTGVRQWHLWMTGFRAANPKAIVVLRGCPRFFIETMNMIYEFVPGPHIVESFVVPMYCESCDQTKEIKFRRGHDFDELGDSRSVVKTPDVNCDVCGKAMEPDFVEQNYFKFIGKSGESLIKVGFQKNSPA
jgi:hypothetical protein